MVPGGRSDKVGRAADSAEFSVEALTSPPTLRLRTEARFPPCRRPVPGGMGKAMGGKIRAFRAPFTILKCICYRGQPSVTVTSGCCLVGPMSGRTLAQQRDSGVGCLGPAETQCGSYWAGGVVGLRRMGRPLPTATASQRCRRWSEVGAMPGAGEGPTLPS